MSTLEGTHQMTSTRKRGKSMLSRSRTVALLAGLAVSLAGAMVTSSADDTEIFFGHSDESFENNPNILFLIDNSNSMRRQDHGVTGRRVDRVRSAMNQILDQSSSFNVGLMAFQDGHAGGGIRYPIGWLEGTTEQICGEDGCDNQTITARPATANDDASQNDLTNAVDVASTTLSMAAVPATTTVAVDADEITRTRTAASDAFEAVITTGDNSAAAATEISVDNLITEWFTTGTANAEPGRVAYRFDNLELPADAEVRSAHITFTRTALGEQLGVMSARISAESTSKALPYLEDVNDPQYLSLANRATDERLTFSTSSWDALPPHVIDADTNLSFDANSEKVVSADVSDILTEVAGLNGWDTDSSVSFIIRPTDEYIVSPDVRRRFYGASATESLRPVLTYTYVEAANATERETHTATASFHLDAFEEASTGRAWTNLANETAQLFHVGDEFSPREVALRFDGFPIPEGAKITSARLSLQAAPDSAPDINDWLPDPTDTSTGGDDGGDDTTDGDDEPVDLGAASGEPNVSLQISAENTPTPALYGVSGFNNRGERTSISQPWTDISEGFVDDQNSPDFSEVIQELIDTGNWQAGGAISLVLSPAGDYQSLPDNIRTFYTSAASPALRPRLEISWADPDAIAEAAANTQTTGIRFDRVFVPPQAEILSAKIIFTAAGADDTPTTLHISAEDNGSPAPFTSASNNVSGRSFTSDRVTWTPEPWDVVGQQYETARLDGIVQSLIERSDWCGGNAMVFLLEGDGQRVAEAYNADSGGSPVLEITYNPSSVPTSGFCSNASLDRSIVDVADDGFQEVGGRERLRLNNNNIVNNTQEARTGTQTSIGLRFQDINIPQGTRIISAALRLYTRFDITGTANLAIEVDDVADSEGFLSVPIEDDRRSWTNASNWTISGNISAGEPIVSSDITSLIETQIARADWESGNSIAFRLSQTGGNVAPRFISHDSSAAFSPDLVIFYESDRVDPGVVFREALKQEVNNLGTGALTPIVSSLYEAARYMRGEAVLHGRIRGRPDVNPNWSRFVPVSHPASYEGGTVYRPAGCDDNNLTSLDCIHERIDGDAQYISPIENQCQTNHIVLLSDGGAFGDDNLREQIEPYIGETCDNARTPELCGRELSNWLEDTDHRPDLPGQQSVEIHSIGFNLNSERNVSFLQDIATEDGGFYSASTTQQLLNVFRTIFNNVGETEASFVSPATTVSSQNRLRNRDDVYFSLFKPESTVRWGGNLKRYRASAIAGGTADLLDRDDRPAVDPDTGEFLESARSFWSSSADGSDVTLGGAAEQLGRANLDNAARNVYTFTGLENGGSEELTHSANSLSKDNLRIDPLLFDIPPPLDTDADYYAQLLDWSRGRDVLDVDGDGNDTETRAELGDALHSSPVLLNYASGKSVVFNATNHGFLHAVDADTGEELWAWMPQELFGNMHDYFQNAPAQQRPYGLDGGVATWVDDTDRDGLIDNNERAVLYLGMRRGGNQYYALDVTDFDKPTFMWKIEGGTNTVDLDPTTADGDYTELAQTWSLPQRTRILDGNPSDPNNIRDVIIFGGGYSTNQDASADGNTLNELRSPDAIGRAIFIADAITGELLWSIDGSNETGMRYSIPSDVAVLDVDLDGIADQLYVGDMGGQVWRFDFNNSRVSNDSVSRRITYGRVAILAGDLPGETRRFYYPPSVSLINADGRQQLAISIGSGWRAHPLDQAVQDRFYSIRSPHVYGPPIDSTGQISYVPVFDDSGIQTPGFSDVTQTIAPDAADITRGWWINLGEGVAGLADNPGEKALARALTADGKIIFTTYRPEAAIDQCSAAIGGSAVTVVNVVNGAPTDAFATPGTEVTLAGRHHELQQSGLAPGASILFHENTDQATISVGTEKIPVDIGELRRRTFWQEIVEGDVF